LSGVCFSRDAALTAAQSQISMPSLRRRSRGVELLVLTEGEAAVNLLISSEVGAVRSAMPGLLTRPPGTRRSGRRGDSFNRLYQQGLNLDVRL
jgi:hypothetical protein